MAALTDNPSRSGPEEQAAGPEAIHDACLAAAEDLGFGWFLYGVRVPVTATRPYQFILSGYPPSWRQHYDAHGYIRIDPVVHHAMNSVLPLHWDAADCESAASRQMFAEAADAGLAHGITIPVHGARGEFSLLSLSGPDPLPVSPRARAEITVAAHQLALQVHESVRNEVLNTHPPQTRPPERLTPRERECLRWVAGGASNEEIGNRLGVSARTVVFHLQNCAEKLGVRGRSHAAARAIEIGEIEPITYPTLISRSQSLIEGRNSALKH